MDIWSFLVHSGQIQDFFEKKIEHISRVLSENIIYFGWFARLLDCYCIVQLISIQ